MVLGVQFSRRAHALHAAFGASFKILVALVVAVNVWTALPALAQGSSQGEGTHNKRDECPPETQQPPRNCDDVRRIAYRNALRRGYANANGNGIPDVMERPYIVNWNDCSTGNAHMACMFNDPCTEQHGTLMGLRSQSAWHATTMYKGKNGQSFECDFTPGSSGIFIANRGDTRIGQAFPDRGESIDPQYAKDGCETNGASSSALNPGGGMFGGGGGSMQDMMMMMAIMQMLQGQKNQNNAQPSIDGQPANSEVVIPTPTPSPSPTPVPTRTPDTRKATKMSVTTKSSTAISDAGIVSPDASRSTSDSSIEEDEESGYSIEGATTTEALPEAEWEEKRDGMF